MITMLLLWFGVLVALLIFAVGPAGRGGALLLSYFVVLSIVHIPGALAFLDPTLELPGQDETELGFKVTLIGMAAFVAGAVLWHWIVPPQATSSVAPPFLLERAYRSLSWRLILAGAACFFVIIPIAGAVPSLTALVSPFVTLLVVGFWLRLYGAYIIGDRRTIFLTIASLPLLLFATIIHGGIISYSTSWVIAIVGFLFVISRRRKWFYLAAVPVMCLGLLAFGSYMIMRGNIRHAVGTDQASVLDRVSDVSDIVANFQASSLTLPLVLYELDNRLNQNFLVGAGVERYRDGEVTLSYGDTVQPWTLIPRAIWPDKPDVGGSGELVSDFTGIQFAENTSVGAGQVLEFYMNFGIYGVVIGFAILGFVLMGLDVGIMRGFAQGDLRVFLPRATVGLVLLQPQGSLMEILVAAVSALIGTQMLLSFDVFGDPLKMVAASDATAKYSTPT